MKIDAALVLGKELLRDPERGRRELAARAAAASVALRYGAGQIFALEDRLKGQDVSGSEIVGAFLRELGVPDDRVRLQARARSTREEAAVAVELLKDHGIRRLAVITSSYHVHRARRYFSRVLPAQSFEVAPPENFLHRATAQERAWILAGTPSPETLEAEARLEQALSALSGLTGLLPGAERLEIAAAAWMRRHP